MTRPDPLPPTNAHYWEYIPPEDIGPWLALGWKVQNTVHWRSNDVTCVLEWPTPLPAHELPPRPDMELVNAVAAMGEG